MIVYHFSYINICVNKIPCINVCVNALELFKWCFPLTLFSLVFLQSGGVVQSYVDGCCRTCESPHLLGASGNALSCQSEGWAPCCLAVDGLIGWIIGDVACCRGCRLSLLLAYHYIFPGLPILFPHLVLTFRSQHSPGRRNEWIKLQIIRKWKENDIMWLTLNI